MSVISQSPFRLRANTRKVTKEFRGLRQPTPWWHYPNSSRTSSSPVWSKNPIRMKSKDDGSRGPCGPDGSVTPRYISKKSPRNVRHGFLETSLTLSRVFSKIEFLDYTGFRKLITAVPDQAIKMRGNSKYQIPFQDRRW